MSEQWNEKEHEVQINEATDASLTYTAEIICDGKIVFHEEKPYTTRFSLMKIHDEFLEIAEKYKKEGILPPRSGFLKKPVIH